MKKEREKQKLTNAEQSPKKRAKYEVGNRNVSNSFYKRTSKYCVVFVNLFLSSKMLNPKKNICLNKTTALNAMITP